MLVGRCAGVSLACKGDCHSTGSRAQPVHMLDAAATDDARRPLTASAPDYSASRTKAGSPAWWSRSRLHPILLNQARLASRCSHPTCEPRAGACNAAGGASSSHCNAGGALPRASDRCKPSRLPPPSATTARRSAPSLRALPDLTRLACLRACSLPPRRFPEQTMAPPVVVLGAGGRTGAACVSALAEQGSPVRAVVRDPGG